MGNYKILAIDDSPSMRSMISFTLKKAGYDIVIAEDGIQGLSTAQADNFDLILTDINMPEMGGIELIGKLRELDTYRHKPILVLTTESSTAMKTKGKSAGATGWIVKPFEPEKLLSALDRVLH